jgi:hypothetical protein
VEKIVFGARSDNGKRAVERLLTAGTLTLMLLAALIFA